MISIFHYISCKLLLISLIPKKKKNNNNNNNNIYLSNKFVIFLSLLLFF